MVEEVSQQAAGNEADTTHDPPYTIGCYHEEVDWALQIEPHQMHDLGEFGRNATEIVSLTVDGDVRTLLFKTDRGELNAIVYQLKSGQLQLIRRLSAIEQDKRRGSLGLCAKLFEVMQIGEACLTARRQDGIRCFGADAGNAQ